MTFHLYKKSQSKSSFGEMKKCAADCVLKCGYFRYLFQELCVLFTLFSTHIITLSNGTNKLLLLLLLLLLLWEIDRPVMVMMKK